MLSNSYLKFFSICLLSSVFSKLQAQESFELIGKLGDPTLEGNTVLLSYSDGAKFRYDTTRVRNGVFLMKGTVQQTAKVFLYVDNSKEQTVLTKKKGQNIRFYLSPGITRIEGTGLENAKISGSQTQREYEKLSADLAQVGWTQPSSKSDTVIDRRNQVYMKFMQQYPNSLVSHDLMDELANPNFFSLHSTQMQKVAEGFPQSWKKSKAGLKVAGLIADAQELGVGKTSIDFTMNDIDGKPVKLSDYRGKFVLLDFWASWCLPCRAENPNVLKAYAQFRDKNFTVVAVSLDKESAKKEWLAAVKKDGLPWSQLSELKGWDSAVAKAYKIKSIPANYLIDPQGKIVGVGLRGENLIKQLEKTLK